MSSLALFAGAFLVLTTQGPLPLQAAFTLQAKNLVGSGSKATQIEIILTNKGSRAVIASGLDERISIEIIGDLRISHIGTGTATNAFVQLKTRESLSAKFDFASTPFYVRVKDGIYLCQVRYRDEYANKMARTVGVKKKSVVGTLLSNRFEATMRDNKVVSVRCLAR